MRATATRAEVDPDERPIAPTRHLDTDRPAEEPRSLRRPVARSACAAVACATVVCGLWVMVHWRLGVVVLDTAINRWSARHVPGWPARVLGALTHLGAAWLVIPALAVTAVADWLRHRRWRLVAMLAITWPFEVLVAGTVRGIVRRPRPTLMPLVSAHGYSFPSGHTAAAAAAWAAIALVIGAGRPRWARVALVATAVGVTVVVAASRVLLGVHWFSDVIAGAAIGWTTVTITSATLKPPDRSDPRSSSRQRRTARSDGEPHTEHQGEASSDDCPAHPPAEARC